MHEGEVSAALGIGGVPVGLRVDDDRPRLRPRRLRGRADPRPAPLGARVGRGDRARQGRRGRGHLRGDPAPPDAHRRGGPQPRLALQDEPAAAHRGRPPGADRGGCARGRSTASPPTTRRTPRDEKEVPFEQAAMGVTGLETAFAVLYTDLVLPGRARARRRWSSGWAPARSRSASSRRGSRPAPRPTSTLCRPRGRVGGRRRGLGEPLGQLLLRRPPAARAGC